MPEKKEKGEVIAKGQKLAALEGFLGSSGIEANSNLARLISYVVTETIEGRADRLKALTIAQDVFGRGATFDPAKDSIVRVEMKRLREKLLHHYETSGESDPVRIEIPKGTYAPEFIPQSAPPATPLAARHRRSSIFALVAVLAVAATGIVFWPRDASDAGEGEPRVVIAAADNRAQEIEDITVGTLARFRNLAILGTDAEGSGPADADYRLDLVTQDGHKQVRLVHLESGTLVASGQFALDEIGSANSPDEYTAYRIWLGQALSRNGLMEADFVRRGQLRGDYVCSALTEAYFRNQTDATHLAARDCILDRLEDGHASSRLYSNLSKLYREEHSDQRNLLPGDPLDRAAQAARDAIALDRFDSGAHYSLMTVLFASGATAEGAAAGERALELNPFDGEAIGGLAARLNYAGDHARALELFDLSKAFIPGGLKWRDYGYFLAYLGLGDLDRAADAGIALRGLTNNNLYIVANAISLSLQGDRDRASELKAMLMEREPDLRDMFERRQYTPELVDRLVSLLEAI